MHPKRTLKTYKSWGPVAETTMNSPCGCVRVVWLLALGDSWAKEPLDFLVTKVHPFCSFVTAPHIPLVACRGSRADAGNAADCSCTCPLHPFSALGFVAQFVLTEEALCSHWQDGKHCLLLLMKWQSEIMVLIQAQLPETALGLDLCSIKINHH